MRTLACCVAFVVTVAVDGYAQTALQQEGKGGASHRVLISGTAFKPATLTVNVGDTIVWKNDDPFAHTVTSSGGRFDSKEIAAGKTWTYRASAKGQFAYICTLHRTMKGTLIVK